MRKTQAQKLESRRERQRLVKKYKWLYLFAFPGVVVLILFAYLPMVGLVMAFQQYDPVSGFFGSPWVGLYNFQRLFSTPTFGRAFRNTLIISTLKLIVCFPMPILVSLLINELRRARVKKTIQTVVYIPNFVSWVIAAGLWYSLLGNSGVVNSLLMGLGITQEPVMFMQSLGWFYPAILFTDLWKTLGYNTIFYMAAMSGISTEQYEAAMMDGAGRFKQAIYITLPSISKTIVLMFILQVGSLMSAGFDQMWTMSNLATRELSDILDTAVLRTLTSGTINDLSVGAAMGLFKSAISLGLFMVTNFLADKFDQGSLV